MVQSLKKKTSRNSFLIQLNNEWPFWNFLGLRVVSFTSFLSGFSNCSIRPAHVLMVGFPLSAHPNYRPSAWRNRKARWEWTGLEMSPVNWEVPLHVVLLPKPANLVHCASKSCVLQNSPSFDSSHHFFSAYQESGHVLSASHMSCWFVFTVLLTGPEFLIDEAKT